MERLRGATMTLMAGMGIESARRMDAVHLAASAFEEAGNERRARELGLGASPASAVHGATGADVARRKQCRFGSSCEEAGTPPALLPPPSACTPTSVGHAGSGRRPAHEAGALGSPWSDRLAA